MQYGMNYALIQAGMADRTCASGIRGTRRDGDLASSASTEQARRTCSLPAVPPASNSGSET